MSWSSWWRRYFKTKQPTSHPRHEQMEDDGLESPGSPLTLSDEELMALRQRAFVSGSEDSEEITPVSEMAVDEELHKASNRLRVLMGEEAFGAWAELIRSCGSPSTWEIRQTPAGTWAVYSPSFLREALFLATSGKFQDFMIAASVVAACNATHIVLSGTVDDAPTQRSVRLVN